MMISTRGRYCLRVMIDLAEHQGEGYIRMKDVANRQGISLKYLEKILPVLAKNNIVDGIQGKGGGYRLTRKPEEYTLREILQLTEGSLAAVSCTSQGPAACDRSECCQTKPMWDRLDKMIDGFFESITLDDLIKESKVQHHAPPEPERGMIVSKNLQISV